MTATLERGINALREQIDAPVASFFTTCVSCGLCAGACPTATPFRRKSRLVPGIELPDLTVEALRDSLLSVAGQLDRTPRGRPAALGPLRVPDRDDQERRDPVAEKEKGRTQGLLQTGQAVDQPVPIKDIVAQYQATARIPDEGTADDKRLSQAFGSFLDGILKFTSKLSPIT